MADPCRPETVEIFSESAVVTGIAHEHEGHQRRPCVVGNSVEPRVAEHGDACALSPEHAHEKQPRTHEGKTDGHAEKEQGEKKDDADDAHKQTAQAGDAVRAEMPGDEQRRCGEDETEDDPARAGLPQHGEQRDQRVAQQREKEQRHARHAEEDEGRIRNAQNGRGLPVEQTIPGHGEDAQQDDEG